MKQMKRDKHGAAERKRRVLELVTLGGLSITEAARSVGISSSTFRDWRESDPAFRAELEAWKAGPPLSEVTVAQVRRIIFDELARRILEDRSKFSHRELIGIYDRITREQASNMEEDGSEDDEEALTREEAERLWAEIEREEKAPQEDAPVQPLDAARGSEPVEPPRNA